MADFSPNHGPQRQPHDASSFFLAKRIYIPGAERMPLNLLGTLADGKTPCSQLNRQAFVSPEGSKLEFRQVTLNIPPEMVHPKKGAELLLQLDKLLEREDAGQVLKDKNALKRLLDNLRIACEASNINLAIEKLADGKTPCLMTAMIYAAGPNEPSPAGFIAGLREIFAQFDEYFRPPPGKLKYASAFFGREVVEIQTSKTRHRLKLTGLLTPSRARASLHTGSCIQIRIPPNVIDPYHGQTKLEIFHREGVLQNELAALLDGLPLREGERAAAWVSSGWGSRSLRSALLRVDFELHGTDIERVAAALGGLREILEFFDTRVPSRLSEGPLFDLSHETFTVMAQSRPDITLEGIVQLRLKKEASFYPAQGVIRPGVPVWEDRGTAAIVRVMPSALNPAVNNYQTREALLAALADTESAKAGEFLINFVEDCFDLGNWRIPVNYWQIIVDLSQQDQDVRLNALDQFLRDYYLTLRTGISPDELDSFQRER